MIRPIHVLGRDDWPVGRRKGCALVEVISNDMDTLNANFMEMKVKDTWNHIIDSFCRSICQA